MAESSLYKAALLKAMNQCSQREYCITEIMAKLETWGLSETESRKIISNLIGENFINEERYALAFVKDKFAYNKWGKIKIAAHLRAKRIPSELITKALDSIDKDLYTNTIKIILQSHRKSVKAKNPYEMKAKLIRFGLSRGFESNLLYDLLNDSDS
jgi:regulatory protein